MSARTLPPPSLTDTVPNTPLVSGTYQYPRQ